MSNLFRRRRYVIGPAILAGFIVLAGFARHAQTAAPLPQQLEDAAFWRMMTELSEAGGSFASENFVSNESNFQLLLTELTSATKPGGAYLGVGPEQNFTYIAALRPSIAFIIDIRRQNLVLHLMYKAIFEMASDRATFLSMLFSRRPPEGLNETFTIRALLSAYKAVPADRELAQKNLRAIKDILVDRHGFPLSANDITTLEHIHHIFELYGPETGYASNLSSADSANRPASGSFTMVLTTGDKDGVNRSFLSNEELFRVVKKMQERNLIVPVVGDFGGVKALRSIGQYLRDQGVVVSAFYLSNVEQYLFQNNPLARNGGAQRFYENAATLPVDSTSMFIRSTNRIGRRQLYPGFTSHLASIAETLQVFREQGLNSIRDVLALSR